MRSIGRNLGVGAASAALALCLSNESASAAEKRFGLTHFDRVEVLTDAQVEIVVSTPVAALATGTQDALDRLQIEARDGRLVISSRKFAGDERRRRYDQPLKIQISAASLRELTVVGGADVQAVQMRGAQIQISLRGAGRVRVEQVSADRLAVQMLGNGMMRLGGQAKQGRVQMSGANHLDAKALAIDDLAVEAEGVGDHHFHAAKRAALTVRGATRVDVAGQPVCTVRNLGSGTIQCGDGAR